jgi:hypothetical protein
MKQTNYKVHNMYHRDYGGLLLLYLWWESSKVIGFNTKELMAKEA